MFQVEESLQTWATEPINQFDRRIELTGKRLSDHRIEYLDFEGDVSGDRGTVTRVLTGTLQVIEAVTDRFVGQMSWEIQTQLEFAFVVCQRIMVDSALSRDETREDWSLLFSPGRYDTKR